MPQRARLRHRRGPPAGEPLGPGPQRFERRGFSELDPASQEIDEPCSDARAVASALRAAPLEQHGVGETGDRRVDDRLGERPIELGPAQPELGGSSAPAPETRQLDRLGQLDAALRARVASCAWPTATEIESELGVRERPRLAERAHRGFYGSVGCFEARVSGPSERSELLQAVRPHDLLGDDRREQGKAAATEHDPRASAHAFASCARRTCEPLQRRTSRSAAGTSATRGQARGGR